MIVLSTSFLADIEEWLQIGTGKEKALAHFDMRGQSVTNQYNAGRDMNFGVVQTPEDLVTALEQLHEQITQAKNAGTLSEETTTDAQYQITKAAQQARKPAPDKKTIVDHLTTANESHPIPVVFPPSSWATNRRPLTEWLASELTSRYQVPPPQATFWIEMDQVLPLLDGLDEVDAPHREACVDTINAYRQVHGLLPTVVCSRQTNYLALSTRLLLRTAMAVQSLTPEQIESYLTSGGE